MEVRKVVRRGVDRGKPEEAGGTAEVAPPKPETASSLKLQATSTVGPLPRASHDNGFLYLFAARSAPFPLPFKHLAPFLANLVLIAGAMQEFFSRASSVNHAIEVMFEGVGKTASKYLSTASTPRRRYFK
jgi:hypothetical protein